MAVAALPALAIGGFGAATSAYAASQQNSAIEASMRSSQRSAANAQQQVADAAGLEQLKNARVAHQTMGRLRVAAADAGTGMGGSYAALTQQTAYDEALNQAIIERNFNNQIRQVRSGYAAEIAKLESSIQNPLLAAFTGGLGGVSTGLSIGSALDELNLLRNTPPRQDYQPVDFNLTR